MKNLLLVTMMVASSSVFALNSGTYTAKTNWYDNTIILSSVTNDSIVISNLDATRRSTGGEAMLSDPITLSKSGKDYIYTKNNCSVKLTNITDKSFKVEISNSVTCDQQEVLTYGASAPDGTGSYKYKNSKTAW